MTREGSGLHKTYPLLAKFDHKKKLTFDNILNLIKKKIDYPLALILLNKRFDAIYPEVLICSEASGSD